MLKSVFFLISFVSLVAFADSFDTVKDGRFYTCAEKSSIQPPTGSLSQLCRMARTGSGQTLYHANRRVFTHRAGTIGAAWYYDNGRVITHSAGTPGATWYYSNGRVLTHSAGTVGATWYYDNGRVISQSMGTSGASMYYEGGSVLTHSAPAMSASDLLFACDFIK